MSVESTKRIAYVLKDINTINEVDLKPNEILIDNENDDFVFITKSGKPIKVKGYITDVIENLLTKNHMTESNQHTIANYNFSGFMAPEDKILLDLLKQSVVEFDDMLQNNIMNSKILINKFDYNISDRNMDMFVLLDNAGHMSSLTGKINLGDRPNRGFVNIQGATGYRNDIIFIECGPEKQAELKIEFDIIYSDDMIKIGDKTYNYDKDRAVYNIDGINVICPIILIRRRNDQLVSEININGRYSNNYISQEELFDISRNNLPNISYDRVLEIFREKLDNGITYSLTENTKIIKSNIPYNTDPATTLSYVSFNNNDIEKVSGLPLDKNCTFKSSPFGAMMVYSEKEGNAVSVNNNGDEFKIDMLIDIGNISNVNKQSIISLYNPLLSDPIFKFNYDGAESFSVEYNNYTNRFNVSELNNITNRYIFVTILIARHNISVILNNKIVALMNIDVDLYNIGSFKINATTIPLGNVVVSNAVDSLDNPYVNDNVILLEKFDIATRENILEYKEVQFTPKNLVDISEDFTISIYNDGVKSNQIKQNSLIELNFNKELVYMINPISKIKNINGNVLLLENDHYNTIENLNKFKIGDNIMISKDDKGIESRYIYEIILIEDNKIIIDKPLDGSFIGYYVSNMEDTNYIQLIDSTQTVIGNVGIRNNTVKIISKRNYTSDSPFKLSYICKKPKSEIIECIKDIESVTFNDTKLESVSSKLIKTVGLSETSIMFNNNNVPKTGNSVAIYNEPSDINLSIKYDLINTINQRSYTSLNNILDVSCNMSIYTDTPLYINDKFVYLDEYIREITVPVTISRDGIVEINIIGNEDGMKTCVISELKLDIKFKDGFNKIFVRKDLKGKVLDYLLKCNDGLFSNISPISMTITQKEDVYEYGRTLVYLTDVIDGFRVVSDNNIIKVQQIDNNKIYRLDKYYIV